VQKGYTYDVYGTPTSTGALANEFDFAGQQTDPAGLQYLRARYMDPGTGTFLSRDPLAAGPGWVGQPFGYASANPATLVDPLGLWSIWFGGSKTCLCGIGICENKSPAPPPRVDSSCLGWAAYTAPPDCAEQLEAFDAWLDDALLGLAAMIGEHPKPSRWGDAPKKVTGWRRHALEQALGRDGPGVSDAAIKDAVTNAVMIQRVRDPRTGLITFRYIRKNATVVLNKTGEIVTAWAENNRGWRY